MPIQQNDKAIKLRGLDIKNFQALYFKHFNENLSDQQALTELTHLVRQLEIIYQPITVSQFDTYIQAVTGEDSDDVQFI